MKVIWNEYKSWVIKKIWDYGRGKTRQGSHVSLWGGRGGAEWISGRPLRREKVVRP